MTPLFEREHEFTCLQKAAESAANGRGQVVHISGEAGIGKSRLIAEFVEQLAGGTVAAIGCCQVLDAPRALGPLFDMSLSLGPSFRKVVESAVYDVDPYTKIASAIAAAGPGVVLVFEDAQYADLASLDVIDFLCKHIAMLQALIIISYRSDEISPDDPLTAVLGRSPSRFTSRLTLGPISERATVSMAQSLGVSSDNVYACAKGNPFLTLKLLRDVTGQPGRIPQAIIQWAVARLAAIEPEQKDWVKLLAYCPSQADRELQQRLADICGYRLARLPGWNGFLVPGVDGAIAFRHEIVREALVAGLSDIDRKQSLRRLLEVLRADKKFAEARAELITSIAQAAGIAQLVIEFTPYAVCQAEARGAYVAAAQHLQSALPFAKQLGPETYAEMIELWACRSSLSEAITEEILREVADANALWRRLDQPIALARNHLLLCRLYRHKADRELAEKHLHIAIELLEGADHAESELALAFAIQVQMLLEERRDDKAIALAKVAAKNARAAGDRVLRLDAHISMAVALQRRQKRRGDATMGTCTILADRWNLHELRARICVSICDEALAAMDLARAERCTADWGNVRRCAPECWKAALDGREALVLVLRGKLSEGEKLASQVLLGDRSSVSMRFPAALASAIGRSYREECDAAALLEDAERLAKAIGDLRSIMLARLGRIERAYLEGRVEDALALCRSEVSSNSDRNILDTDRLMRLWRDRLEQIIYGKTIGDGSPDAWADSVANPVRLADDFAKLGYAFQAALAKLFADGPEAPRLFNEAVTEFSVMGAKAGQNCARRVADLRGIALDKMKHQRGPYLAARSNPLGLTRREVEILQMMVDGKGNRDIADQLGRSLRTIEHHVSAILGKLSLETRIQAVLFAIANPTVLKSGAEVE